MLGYIYRDEIVTHSCTLGTCAPLGKLMLNMWSTHCTAKELIKEKKRGRRRFWERGTSQEKGGPAARPRENIIYFSTGADSPPRLPIFCVCLIGFCALYTCVHASGRRVVKCLDCIAPNHRETCSFGIDWNKYGRICLKAVVQVLLLFFFFLLFWTLR